MFSYMYLPPAVQYILTDNCVYYRKKLELPKPLADYYSGGAVCTEVEVDVLTGENLVQL